MFQTIPFHSIPLETHPETYSDLLYSLKRVLKHIPACSNTFHSLKWVLKHIPSCSNIFHSLKQVLKHSTCLTLQALTRYDSHVNMTLAGISILLDSLCGTCLTVNNWLGNQLKFHRITQSLNPKSLYKHWSGDFCGWLTSLLLQSWFQCIQLVSE